MPGRRSRRGRSKPARSKFVTRRELHVIESGKVFIPPSDPRTYVSSPWNSVITYNRVTPLAASGWQSMDLNSIRVAARQQLGLPNGHEIDCRLMRAQMYALTFPADTQENIERTFAIQFFNPITGATIANGEDVGTITRLARVGYQWPRFIQEFPIANSANPTLWQYDHGGSSSTIAADYICQVHLLWRCSTYDPNPSKVASVVPLKVHPLNRSGTSRTPSLDSCESVLHAEYLMI